MMIRAQTFLAMAVIAALMGFSGIAGTSYDIFWMLLVVVGLLLAAVFGWLGHRATARIAPSQRPRHNAAVPQAMSTATL